MASQYGYITLAELEAYTSTDYSSISSDYTDANVEAVISQAERMVNIYCGQSFGGTIPDGVKAVTLELAARMMYNKLYLDGFTLGDNNLGLFPLIIEKDEWLTNLLERYRITDVDEPSQTINNIPLFMGPRGDYGGYV